VHLPDRIRQRYRGNCADVAALKGRVEALNQCDIGVAHENSSR